MADRLRMQTPEQVITAALIREGEGRIHAAGLTVVVMRALARTMRRHSSAQDEVVVRANKDSLSWGTMYEE